jgi:hypothetical protein
MRQVEGSRLFDIRSPAHNADGTCTFPHLATFFCQTYAVSDILILAMNAQQSKIPTKTTRASADCQLAQLVHVISTQYDGDTVACFSAIRGMPIPPQVKTREVDAVSVYLKNSR